MGAPRTVWFRHHMQGGRPWRIAPPDNASLLHPFELSLSSSVLLRVQTACWGRNRWALCLHVVAHVVFSRPGRETETNYLRKLRQNFLIADLCGNTLIVAPVSTRKNRRDRVSR